MPNAPARPHINFASLAHSAVIGNDALSVKQIAAELSMKENTLYAKLIGRTKFDVEEARNLLGFVPDPDLAGYVLERSIYIAAERAHAEHSHEKALQHEASRVVWEAADALRTVEHAISDGKIDHREKSEIRRQVEEAERAVASLKSLTEDF